mgnify:CR=1 FL=1
MALKLAPWRRLPASCEVVVFNDHLHDEDAIASHALNVPHAKHFHADITTLPIDQMPWCHIATFSPACPAWTTANGLTRDMKSSSLLYSLPMPATARWSSSG